MADTAKLTFDGNEYELPIIEGTEGERAIDISRLRATAGCVTLDPGYKNTGATRSAITFLDGEEGILRYRGYPIEQLAEKSSFVEVSYMLIYGELPNAEQLAEFGKLLTYHSIIHEDMRHFFDGFPTAGHPMSILSSMVATLSAYYPGCMDTDSDPKTHITRLLSKIPTIAAFSYKKTMGQPFDVPARTTWAMCDNFLRMLLRDALSKPYEARSHGGRSAQSTPC